jgi:phytoene/squalene synthetase
VTPQESECTNPTGGEKHYKVLMDEYPKVTAVFLGLKKEYQDVIADITKRMGAGMSNFIKREVVTLKDWDEYCHYVAGLVVGLSLPLVSDWFYTDNTGFHQSNTTVF